MGLQNWSTTPANNANAAPNINMATGSAPSTVHPSVRQMMADVASWYADPEWVLQADTPTYTSATTFTVPTNRTATYSVGRRIQMAGPGIGAPYTINGTITASAFGTVTTVTVQWDAGALDNTVSSVAVGILQNQLSTLLSDLANTTDPTKGAAMVGFSPAGTGAVGRTLLAKELDTVCVFDYMTAAQIADAQSNTGAIDATASFMAAHTVNPHIKIPAGTFLLNGYTPAYGETWDTAGYFNTKIKQGSTSNPAIVCTSVNSSGQFLGVDLSGFTVVGAPGATVEAVHIEASGTGAVTASTFDFYAKNTYSPLLMLSPVGATYNNTIKVISDVSAINATTTGAYNKYELFITNVVSGIVLIDTSSGCNFLKVIVDGTCLFNGDNNKIGVLICEDYTAAASNIYNCIVRIGGALHTFDLIEIINIPGAKADSGINVFGSFTNIGKIAFNGPAYPNYPLNLSSGSSGSIHDCQWSGSQLDTFTSGSILRAWTFSGNTTGLLVASSTRNALNINVNTTAGTGDTVYFGTNSITNDWYDAFVINLTANIAALTITLPQAPVNQQTARISAGAFGITTLTLTPAAGVTVVNAPTTLPAGSSFLLVFNAASSQWIRIA